MLVAKVSDVTEGILESCLIFYFAGLMKSHSSSCKRHSASLRIKPSKPQEKRECTQELVPRGTRTKKSLLVGSTSCFKSNSPGK